MESRGDLVVRGTKFYKTLTVVQLVDAVINRVGVINQILGCKYEHQVGNPCEVFIRRGLLTVNVCGGELATSRMYDGEGLIALLIVLDSLEGGLWLMRSGGVKFTCIQ